jgi:hypothetical protein
MREASAHGGPRVDINQSLDQLKDKALSTAQRLSSTDPEVRAVAAAEILEIVQDLQEFAGNELLTVLASRLSDPEEIVRVRSGARYIRNARILPVLPSSRQDTKRETRRPARLGEMSSRAVRRSHHRHQGERRGTIAEAVRALEDQGPPHPPAAQEPPHPPQPTSSSAPARPLRDGRGGGAPLGGLTSNQTS